MVICLERDADLHMAQLMPLPLTVSCFSKIQIGFTFLVPAHPGSPGQRAVKRACVRACVCCLCSGWKICHLLPPHLFQCPFLGKPWLATSPLVGLVHLLWKRNIRDELHLTGTVCIVTEMVQNVVGITLSTDAYYHLLKFIVEPEFYVGCRILCLATDFILCHVKLYGTCSSYWSDFCHVSNVWLHLHRVFPNVHLFIFWITLSKFNRF